MGHLRRVIRGLPDAHVRAVTQEEEKEMKEAAWEDETWPGLAWERPRRSFVMETKTEPGQEIGRGITMRVCGLVEGGKFDTQELTIRSK